GKPRQAEGRAERTAPRNRDRVPPGGSGQAGGPAEAGRLRELGRERRVRYRAEEVSRDLVGRHIRGRGPGKDPPQHKLVLFGQRLRPLLEAPGKLFDVLPGDWMFLCHLSLLHTSPLYAGVLPLMYGRGSKTSAPR